MKILLIEDNRLLGKLYSTALTSKHYTVDIATDGETGLELTELSNYDLILLDIELPKLDGLSVCRKLRSQGFTIPILMLTSHSSSEAIIKGLDAGADDYLVKPCNFDELLARIRALLRRGATSTTSSILTWGELCLDTRSAQVTYQDQIITLRPKEYSLLELCLRYPQKIFTRDAIIDHLWKMDDSPSTYAVTNLIKDLRLRLKKAGMSEELIETVYGIGYRIQSPPEIKTRDRQAEPEARQAPETTLSDILNNAGAAISSFRVFADGNWEIYHIAAGCEVISGYTPEELVADQNLWVSRIFPEDWQGIESELFANIFAERTGTYEYRFYHKDGTVRWFSQTSSSRWDELNNCWFVTAVTSDISDRKKIESSKDEFISIVTQQFPSSLAAIRDALSFLETTIDKRYTKKAKRLFEITSHKIDTLLGQINQL